MDFAIFEETNVSYSELLCSSCLVPFAIDLDFAGLGVFPNPQEVVESNDGEVSGCCC